MCPADLILLDTSLPKNRDMICWLNTQGIDGFSDLTMKKATQATKVENGSTRKGNYPEYRKLLSGKIEYDPPNALYRSFAGYIKLKKDPRAEPITNDNFIPRGAVLKNTEWYRILGFSFCLKVLGFMVLLLIQEMTQRRCSDQEDLLRKETILTIWQKSSLSLASF